MTNILDQKICVWGTGKFGEILIKQLYDYEPICRYGLKMNLFENIKYFVDNNLERSQFYGKPVKQPKDLYEDCIDLCIIAVLNNAEICADLELHGFRRETGYMSSDKWMNICKKEIVSRRREIFINYGLDFMVNTKELELIELIGMVQRNFDNLNNMGGKEDRIIRYVIFSVLIDSWKDQGSQNDNFKLICESFETVFVVSAFAWYFGNDISEISEWFSKYIKVDSKNWKRKPTIGIVIDDYYGGGVEKVISLLLPLYVNKCHKVVLISSSNEPDKEYGCPEEVIRFNVTARTGNEGEERLRQLSECVIKNKIDIMCFHTGYTYISTFYEILLLKLLKTAVLIEIHSAFLPVIRSKKSVSKYYSYMYRFADKTIVLSQADKVFWENLGCNCEYIQNPIEIKARPNIRHESRGNILWVGRLVEVPKNVFDIVPIMFEVVKQIPDVKLQVVGLVASQWNYNRLVELIKRNNLEKNIELCGYNSNIDSFYQQADVILMTSSSESFCNVIMEGQSWGVPIVMYELPWLELLRSGKGFIAVKQRDVKAAADALIKLLSDDERRRKMSLEAIENIKHFREYDVYSDWEKVFDGIANGNGKKEFQNPEFKIIEEMLLGAVYDE